MSLKYWYLAGSSYGITTQNTNSDICTPVKPQISYSGIIQCLLIHFRMSIQGNIFKLSIGLNAYGIPIFI